MKGSGMSGFDGKTYGEVLTRALAGIGPFTVINGVTTMAYFTSAVLRVGQPLTY
jgi:hypothetical protein